MVTTWALEVSAQAQILDLLRRLQRDLRVPCLFISHNRGVVAYVADRLIVMIRGRVEKAVPVAAVHARPRVGNTRPVGAVPLLER